MHCDGPVHGEFAGLAALPEGDLDGKIVGRLQGAMAAHGVAVTDAGDVYLAQLSGVVQKYVKE